VLAVEPEIGTRYAELIEMPVMLLVIYLSARFVVSKMYPVKSMLPFLFTGLIALALLLTIEFTLVLGLRGISMEQYLDSRDAIAFGAYILALIVFALMPLLLGTGQNRRDASQTQPAEPGAARGAKFTRSRRRDPD